MARPGEAPPTREEVLALFCVDEATDPATLAWAPLMGLFRGTLRLRMHITRGTMSEELLEAIRAYRYPDGDVLEVQGLIRAVQDAASRAGIPLRLEPGPRDLVTGVVASFQPWKVHWPFPRAKLSLAIAPGEFQWILSDARKEGGPNAQSLARFQEALLEETRAWILNGNR